MKQLLIFISVMCSVNLSAQVTIGALKEPHEAAVLDLSQVNLQNLGLLMPQVELTALTSFQLLSVPSPQQKIEAMGMIVYNKAFVNDKLYPGLYVWDGSKWGRIIDGISFDDAFEDAYKDVPKKSGKYSLSGSTCYDVKNTTNVNPVATPVPGTGPGSVTAVAFLSERADDFSGGDLTKTYYFYHTGDYSNLNLSVKRGGDILEGTTINITPANQAGNGVGIVPFILTFKSDVQSLVSTATDKQVPVTILATFTDAGATNQQLRLDINVKDNYCGCPVKTHLTTPHPTGYMSLMCHNLGADDLSIDEQKATAHISSPYNYSGILSDKALAFKSLYGDFYQWGRKADGHQNVYSSLYSATNGVPYGDIDANFQLKSSHDAYGQFIRYGSTYNDWIQDQSGTQDYSTTNRMYPNRWNGKIHADNANDVSKGPGDPYPTGWRVPTRAEWQNIIRNSGRGGPGNYINRWVWINGGTTNPSGYEVYRPKPEASMTGDVYSDYETTPALWLPAVGFRNGSSFGDINNIGHYWSSTVTNTTSHYLRFPSNDVNPGDQIHRTYGFSVRCVVD
jgi:uncharacterized protein (TIGR02145 family)